MSVRDIFFSGSCEIEIDGRKLTGVLCQLDINQGVIECYDNSLDWQDPYAFFAKNAVVSNLVLSTPFGKITLEGQNIFKVNSANPGAIKVTNTNLMASFENTDTLSCFSLRPGKNLIFDCPESGDEILYQRGADIYGHIKIADFGTVLSSKTLTAIEDPYQPDDFLSLIVASLACGIPLRPVASVKRNKMTLFQNMEAHTNYRRHSLYFDGEIFRDSQQGKSGFPKLAESALHYFLNLPEQERQNALGAFATYLEARSATNFIELQILGLFNFLEWFCESRTLSKNALRDKLNISLDEAVAVNNLRNATIHNKGNLGERYMNFARSMDAINEINSDVVWEHIPDIFALNYLISATDRAILERLYTGLEHKLYFLSNIGRIWM